MITGHLILVWCSYRKEIVNVPRKQCLAIKRSQTKQAIGF
jgi:hypothetical protein